MQTSTFMLLLLMVGALLATSCGGGDEQAAAPELVITSMPAATAGPAVRLEPTAPTPSPTPAQSPALPATPTASPTATPALPSTPAATPVARSDTRTKGVDQIAFVGLERQIYTVDPDGSHPRRISPETGDFSWPTWSPDASKLVFSGVVEDKGGGLRISLFAFIAASTTLREVYVGEPGVVGLLAAGVVHYPLWSPDSTRVAFIAVASGGLSLFLGDPKDINDATFILDQGPLWMSWSPDSQYLLVHRGAEHFLVNTLGKIQVNELDIRAVGYRVPAWKPSGAIVTLASALGPGRYAILTAEVVADGLDAPRPITSLHEIGFPLNPAFLWSPSGDFLALAGSTRVISYLGLHLFVYRDLALFSESQTAPPILIQDNVMAYFWSPDGSKLAYVAPSEEAGALRWTVFNVANGERWPLVDFIPSLDQLTMFQFFDQYAYSHSLWSPDSRSLVFAGTLVDGADLVSVGSDVGHQGSHIIVVGTDPDPLTQTIAEGTLGIWSPQ